MIKICNCCKQEKSLDHYRVNRETKDGLTTYCKACLYAQQKEWKKKNKERMHVKEAEYRELNRKTIRETAKRWRENNKGKKNADTAKRFAAKMQRMPKWLTKEEKIRIRCYYQLASMYTKESGYDWHVDHIIPMRGTDVSGLHVPWNLRVIPATDNIRKGNRHNG